MIKIKVEHEQYKHGEFIIDIFKNADGYNKAYLRHKNNGVSSLMFGVPVKACSYRAFLFSVEENLDDYIKSYAKEYMD